MYKWPQGRVIRIICLILAAVVALDLAYNGGYARFEAYRQGGEVSVRQAILAGFFAVLSLVAAIAAVIAVGFHKVAVDFLIEVEQEMLKVEWPKPPMVWRSTLVIAVVVVIVTGIIFLMDAIILWSLNHLRSFGGYF